MEGSPHNETARRLRPIDVARNILALSNTQSREGSMLRIVANNITANTDFSQITEDELYFSINAAFTKTDSGWEGKDSNVYHNGMKINYRYEHE